MKFTREQIKEAIATIYGALCNGEDELDLLNDLGLSKEDFDSLKGQMFEVEAEKVRQQPVEHTYVQYMIDQIHNLRILEDIISHYKDSKQYNAIVGAVRTRADILDRVIAKGQEFGLIKKVPERKELIGGLVVAELTSKDLKSLITKSLSTLNHLISTYGDKDILDVSVGSIHHGKRLPEAMLDVKEKKSEEKSKYLKANNVKRIAGRVVTKKKKH